jgi:hypothetical protein
VIYGRKHAEIIYGKLMEARVDDSVYMYIVGHHYKHAQ